MMLLLLFFIAITAYPVPKYYDFVIMRCSQNGQFRNPNCHNLTWSILQIQAMLSWGQPFTLDKDCNLTKREHINGTTILPYLRPIEAQLNKHWHTCGECDGNCTNFNPGGWFLTWANGGVCSNWTIPEYFTNGLLMFMDAAGQDFYGCCTNQIAACHIPYTPDLKFMGCYWPANDWVF